MSVGWAGLLPRAVTVTCKGLGRRRSSYCKLFRSVGCSFLLYVRHFKVRARLALPAVVSVGVGVGVACGILEFARGTAARTSAPLELSAPLQSGTDCPGPTFSKARVCCVTEIGTMKLHAEQNALCLPGLQIATWPSQLFPTCLMPTPRLHYIHTFVTSVGPLLF